MSFFCDLDSCIPVFVLLRIRPEISCRHSFTSLSLRLGIGLAFGTEVKVRNEARFNRLGINRLYHLSLSESLSCPSIGDH